MKYYVQLFDKAFGPLTKEKIRRLFQLKKITLSTIVSIDMENWKTLDSFPELVESKESPVFQPQEAPQEPNMWNYSLDGVDPVGPVTLNELYNLAKSGFIHGDTVVPKQDYPLKKIK